MILILLFWFNLLIGYQNSGIASLRNYYEFLPRRANVEVVANNDIIEQGVFYDNTEYIDGLILHQYTVVYNEVE